MGDSQLKVYKFSAKREEVWYGASGDYLLLGICNPTQGTSPFQDCRPTEATHPSSSTRADLM